MGKKMQKPIAHSRLVEFLEYNQESGEFSWRVTRSRTVKGSIAGTLNTHGYVKIKIDGRLYSAHRLAWFLCHGAWPEGEIDHINGVRNDNRIANFRVVDRAGNAQNQISAQANNSSGYLGIWWDKNKCRWCARISKNKKVYNIGSFRTAEEAHNAYMQAKSRLHISVTRTV